MTRPRGIVSTRSSTARCRSPIASLTTTSGRLRAEPPPRKEAPDMDERVIEQTTRRELRQLTAAGLVAIGVLIVYWTLWFAARSTVASVTTRSYYDFENALPAADAWLGVCVVLALRAARARRPSALLWLLAGGGAGVYLFAMDVLYDLEHGIYGQGAGGLIELTI